MTNHLSTHQQIAVQVAYALADKQIVINLKVDTGCTAVGAVTRSGIFEQLPEIKLQPLKLGIFSKPIPHDAVLEKGMRVEIYRPLIADPKEARRQRALLAKKLAK